MFASFNDVRKFFESWGLYPSAEEVPPELNSEVIEQGINVRCYEKLVEESSKSIFSSAHKEYFRTFCQRSIDATDGAFYLSAETWDDLEEAWDDYVFSLTVRK